MADEGSVAKIFYFSLFEGPYWLKGFKQLDDHTKITFPGKVEVAKMLDENITLYEYMKNSSLTIIQENGGKVANEANVYFMESMNVPLLPTEELCVVVHIESI